MRLFPASAVKELRDGGIDKLDRGYFALVIDCEHGRGSAVICSERRTIAELMPVIAKAAMDSCPACRSMARGG